MAERATRLAATGLLAALLAACAGGAPKPDYPAFVQAQALPDAFLAVLPGVRAKRLAGDPETRRFGSVVTLPPDWRFGTGAAPDMSVEIYVLAGRLELADLALGPGGYAYLPAGSLGLSMGTRRGAQILYFLDAADPAAVIGTPLILDRDQLDWQPAPDASGDRNVWIKELRADPGSGSRTVLRMIEPGAAIPWRSSDVAEEGYLIEGRYRHSECVAGETSNGAYEPGGYYYRPPGRVNGGPGSGADATAIWFVRTRTGATEDPAPGCSP